jgi:four helix bundle protein
MAIGLEDRFLTYALRVRDFCGKVKFNTINKEYISQLVRSSASVGANYIEASDPLGKADELMKLRISRREAKESGYWLKLFIVYEEVQMEKERGALIAESEEIRNILSFIIRKEQEGMSKR